MKTDHLSVALLQHADRGSRAANQAMIRQRIVEAAQAGARLILLQELHNETYFCQTEDVAQFDRAEPIPGPGTAFLGELAASHGVVIVGSLFERRGAGVYHNTAVVMDTDGRLAGRYRKMHIPDDPGYYEKFYFTPGDLGFVPIDTTVGRLGVLLCWDQWYPEAARLMALAGADLLLYPTAIGWNPGDHELEKARQLDAWITIQRAHAVANGIPVVVCNRVGHESSPRADDPGISFWGNSFVCGPQGEMLEHADQQESLLLARLDLARNEVVRRVWPFLRDRRIEEYANLGQRLIDQ